MQLSHIEIPDENLTPDQIASMVDFAYYMHHDELIISPETMGDMYEGNLRMFHNEHMHDYDEVRFMIKGSTFFDVRNESDKWVRIEVGKGDLIKLPAGIYHRWTPDETNVSYTLQWQTTLPKLLNPWYIMSVLLTYLFAAVCPCSTPIPIANEVGGFVQKQSDGVASRSSRIFEAIGTLSSAETR